MSSANKKYDNVMQCESDRARKNMTSFSDADKESQIVSFYPSTMTNLSLLSTAALAVAAAIGFYVFSKWMATFSSSRVSIPSPATTLLPKLSPSAASALPYPPDFFPSPSDIPTPHGSIRTYEWGPTAGQKVILIHGDTSPSPIFHNIAHGLVFKGCRVMLFDLWGRGYTDAPLGVKHNPALYAKQIDYAMTSSQLEWRDGFSLIGFSLGGGIAMHYAATHPELLESVVLLGPAGIVRRLPAEYTNWVFKFPFLERTHYVRRAVAKCVGATTPMVQGSEMTKSEGAGNTADRQKPDMAAIVQWQWDSHEGFLHSFVDTLRYGPILHEHENWRAVCKMLKMEKAPARSTEGKSGLYGGKLLIIFGDDDTVVRKSEVVPDLEEMLDQGAEDHLVIRNVPGGHGFPTTEGPKVVEHIANFWKLPSR